MNQAFSLATPLLAVTNRSTRNTTSAVVVPFKTKDTEIYSHLVRTEDGLSATFELIKILRLYQLSNRWTLLIAPEHIPDRALLDCCSIDMGRVLIVHEKRVSSVMATIENALAHATCAAVVAWSNTIDHATLAQLNPIAERSRCHFYIFNKHNAATTTTSCTLS